MDPQSTSSASDLAAMAATNWVAYRWLETKPTIKCHEVAELSPQYFGKRDDHIVLCKNYITLYTYIKECFMSVSFRFFDQIVEQFSSDAKMWHETRSRPWWSWTTGWPLSGSSWPVSLEYQPRKSPALPKNNEKKCVKNCHNPNQIYIKHITSFNMYWYILSYTDIELIQRWCKTLLPTAAAQLRVPWASSTEVTDIHNGIMAPKTPSP